MISGCLGRAHLLPAAAGRALAGGVVGTAGSAERRAAGEALTPAVARTAGPLMFRAGVTQVMASSDLFIAAADTLSSGSISRHPAPFEVVGLGFQLSCSTNVLLKDRQSRSGFSEHVLSTQPWVFTDHGARGPPENTTDQGTAFPSACAHPCMMLRQGPSASHSQEAGWSKHTDIQGLRGPMGALVGVEWTGLEPPPASRRAPGCSFQGQK